MKHTLKTFPNGKTTHIAEEVMLSMRGIIKGRVLCGGLKHNNTYTRPVPRDMNRDAWFTPVQRQDGITCKKCNDRHNRFMDEYEQYRAELDPGAPTDVQFHLKPGECILNVAGVCQRTDEVHENASLESLPKDMFWVCPLHPDTDN